MHTYTITQKTNVSHCRGDIKEAATLAADILQQTQPRANLDCFWAYAEQIVFTAIILHAAESDDIETVGSLEHHLKPYKPEQLSGEMRNSPNESVRNMWAILADCDARLTVSMLSGIKDHLGSLRQLKFHQPAAPEDRQNPLWLLICVVHLPKTIALALRVAKRKPEVLGRRRTDYQLIPYSRGSKRMAA